MGFARAETLALSLFAFVNYVNLPQTSTFNELGARRQAPEPRAMLPCMLLQHRDQHRVVELLPLPLVCHCYNSHPAISSSSLCSVLSSVFTCLKVPLLRLLLARVYVGILFPFDSIFFLLFYCFLFV